MDQSDTIHLAGNEGHEPEPGHLIDFPGHAPVSVEAKMSCGREGSESWGNFSCLTLKWLPSRKACQVCWNMDVA